MKRKVLDLIGISDKKTSHHHKNRSWIYNHRLSQFKILSSDAPIIMVGDSLIENGEWNELLPNYKTLNRGISGDTVQGLDRRLYEVIDRNPEIVVGMIGINDVAAQADTLDVIEAISHIVERLIKEHITVLWQSIIYTSPPRDISNTVIEEVNSALQKNLTEYGAYYLDVNQALSEDKLLSAQVSEDGLHLNGEGYRRWAELIDCWLKTYRESNVVDA